MKTLEFKHFDNSNGGGCRVYENGSIVRGCTATGCGYDRQGAAFGNYIMFAFRDEVFNLFKDELDNLESNRKSASGFYGVTLYSDSGNKGISLDGMCGFNCMEEVLNAIGYKLTWFPTRSNGSYFYALDKI